MVEWTSEGASTAEHEVANDVIKYLRWRNSDGSGMVAAECIGVAFDVAEPLSTTAEYCEWVLGDRGQAGYRLSHTAPFFLSSATGSMSGHIGTVDARIAWSSMGHVRDRDICAGG